MDKIYIAIPYSSVNKEESFRLSNKIAAEQYKMGNIVYAPVSHSHPIAIQEGLPGGFEFWEKIDFEFIRWADYVLVIKMEGWKESKGVQKEIAYCRMVLKKPVHLLDLETRILTEDITNE